MFAEGELRSNNLEDSDRVRDLQDKVAELRAEVSLQLQNCFYDRLVAKINKLVTLTRFLFTTILINTKNIDVTLQSPPQLT